MSSENYLFFVEDNSTDSAVSSNDQRVWSIPECKQVFAQALRTLKEESEVMLDEQLGIVVIKESST